MQYDEVMRIIELIYGGQVDVPKISFAKFTAAAKVLKINGFDKIDDVNPDDLEEAFEMRNCYVRLTDVTIKMNAIAPPNAATVTENTPPNSAPATPFASPDFLAGTSKTGSMTSNTAPNSKPTQSNSCGPVSEFGAADAIDAPVLTHKSKASKRSSTGHASFVHPKKNRLRLPSLNGSSDSDSSLVPTASKPSANGDVALCHPKKNPLRLQSLNHIGCDDRPLVPLIQSNPGKLNEFN